MTEKLQKLISLAITDGVITDKERDVLIKKAIEEGVDLDEFEMELDARLFERQQELKAQTASQITPPPAPEKPKSNKEGDIKKCPSCGASVQSFVLSCLECGHEFRNVQVISSIERLMKMLNEVEITNSKSSDAKYASIISNFPIPNSKEDLLEFLAHSTSEANKKISFWDKLESDSGPVLFKRTWKSKCEQIIIKARFSMKNDPKTLEEIEYYAQQLKIK